MDIYNEELRKAVRKNEKEKVKFYLDKGADINSVDELGYNSLFYSVVNFRKEILEVLLEHEADVNYVYKNGKNILQIAVESECEDKGNIDIVILLLQRINNVNAKDKYGNTALWHACINYRINLKTINLLLLNGADPYAFNSFGTNCVLSAENNDEKELLKLLRK